MGPWPATEAGNQLRLKAGTPAVDLDTGGGKGQAWQEAGGQAAGKPLPQDADDPVLGKPVLAPAKGTRKVELHARLEPVIAAGNVAKPWLAACAGSA